MFNTHFSGKWIGFPTYSREFSVYNNICHPPPPLFFHNLKGKQSTCGPFGIGENWFPNKCPAELCRDDFERVLQKHMKEKHPSNL